ncbi:MAG: ChpI protein [Spirochaetales bacterium]|nr:ChpI protein [Spirochaetales bacterium]
MKTAISVPDSVYAEAEEVAEALGIPRSQLYARALEEFVRKHRVDAVTERLDAVYGPGGTAPAAETPPEDGAAVESIRTLTRHDSW